MDRLTDVGSAREIIGTQQTDDYVIDPAAHVETFKERAPGMAALLNASDVRTAAREYKRWDRLAMSAQERFQRWSTRTHWVVFLTICLSAALAAAGAWAGFGELEGEAPRIIIAVLALASAGCGAVASVGFARIRAGHLLEEWMHRRAEAESHRLLYFELITRPRTESDPASISLTLLQLEYFRRFQLDVQQAYYARRGQEHARAGDRVLSASTWAMGGAMFVNGLAGILGWLEPAWAAVAALALVSQAFASTISNTEAVNQHRRNAERYERTRTVLARLSGELDRIRSRILEGDHSALTYFVEAVHEQLSLEHRQWIDTFSKRLSAIGRLEQHLNNVNWNAPGT